MLSRGQKQTAGSTVPVAMFSANLPVELLVDILYRLPTESLCRFKCVSKSFRALISHPYFAKTHLDRNHNKRERVILISDFLYSFDCNEASKNDSVMATKLDFVSRPIEDRYQFQILGSFNGLVLVSTEITTKFLLNPSTREYQMLPDSPFRFSLNSFSSYTMYGLGYDSSADDYKVVAIEARVDDDDDDDDDDGDDDAAAADDESWCTLIIARVYSVKTDSWRRIDDAPYYHSHLDLSSSSSLVLVNGSLHWFTSCDLFVIATFDVADEKFCDVQIPSSLDNTNFNLMYCTLGVLGGCLCILVPNNLSVSWEFWVMKEYRVTESWTKFTSVSVLNECMTEPLCLLVDGEVLLEIAENKLVAFNAKEKTSREIEVCGIPAMFKAGKTYVESLVSPCYNYGCEIERNYEGSENLKSYQLDSFCSWISDTQDSESHPGASHFEEQYQRYERKIEKMMGEQMDEMEQMREEMEQMKEQMQQIQSSWSGKAEVDATFRFSKPNAEIEANAQNANNHSCPNASPSVPSTENLEGANCELLHYNGTGLVVATGEVVSLDPTILVNDAPLSSDCWKVRVNYIFEPEVPLYRAHPSYFLLRRANGNSIAWLSKFIKITGPSR